MRRLFRVPGFLVGSFCMYGLMLKALGFRWLAGLEGLGADLEEIRWCCSLGLLGFRVPFV